MKIIIDTREQTPYTFNDEAYTSASIERGTLQTADYSIYGLENYIAIERKSLADLIGSLTTGRERFEAELQRGKALEFFGLVIEGSMEEIKNHAYKSRASPKSVLQSLVTFSVRYNIHVFFADSRAGGEYLTYSLLQKYLLNKEKQLRAILQNNSQIKEVTQ